MQIILIIFTVNSENFAFAEGEESKLRLNCDIAQVTTLAAVARVRSQVRLRGICGGKSSIGAGFVWVLLFTLVNSSSTDGSTLIITLFLALYSGYSERR